MDNQFQDRNGQYFDATHFPEDVSLIVSHVSGLWDFTIPGKRSKNFGYWITAAREISENIEAISLNDQEGWQRMAVALEACMEVVDSGSQDVKRLTGLCIAGMEAICEKKVKNL